MNFWQTLTSIHKHTALFWWQFWLLCLFFCTLSFGQLGRVEVGPASFYLHDCVIAIWLVSNWKLTYRVFTQLYHINWKYWWSGLAFLGWLCSGMVVAWFATHDLLPWLYVSRVLVYLIFLYTVHVSLGKSPFVIRVLLVSSGIYMVWFGLLQYLLIPDARYLEAFGWDEHYFRLIGPLLDPNLSGMEYIAVGWMICSLRKKLSAVIWIPTLILTAVAIVLSYSRATYLAASVSLVLYFLLAIQRSNSIKKWLLGMLIVLLFSAVAYAAAPKPGGDGVNLFRTTSIMARIDTTQHYLKSLQPFQWVTGTGFYTTLPGSFPFSHARVPDNFFILLVVNTGIIGALLFFTFFTKLFHYIKEWENETLATLVALLVHAQFNNSVLEPFIFLTLGMMILSQLNQEEKH